MNAYGLPVTGLGGATIAGIYFDQVGLVALGAGLVLAGIVAIRLSYRRNKALGDR